LLLPTTTSTAARWEPWLGCAGIARNLTAGPERISWIVLARSSAFWKSACLKTRS
jgi:hypothetical protein